MVFGTLLACVRTPTKVMEQHLVGPEGVSWLTSSSKVREVQSIQAVLAYDIRDFDRRACRPASMTATRHHEVLASVDALAEVVEQHRAYHHARSPNG